MRNFLASCLSGLLVAGPYDSVHEIWDGGPFSFLNETLKVLSKRRMEMDATETEEVAAPRVMPSGR